MRGQYRGKTVNSPPHRWLRKCIYCVLHSYIDSPPHRWLRNTQSFITTNK
ncbi:hypothetical protein [uncultured Gammaproteobacteria bacterium]|nr:hypothetical protein [uncultured Gammaproteobacteria bacterium]